MNAVGVDVNTASPAILAYIAGLNKAIAQQIVEYRKEHGVLTRQALKMYRVLANVLLNRQLVSCVSKMVQSH